MQRKLISRESYIYYYSIKPDFVDTEPPLYTIYNIKNNITYSKLSCKYHIIHNLYKIANVEGRYGKFW